MKASKVIAAAIAGTTFMTLYSYYMAKKEKQKFVEPELLNELIDRSENLPDIQNKKEHPAGWVIHYALGAAFVVAYWLLWRRSLNSPGIAKGLLIGAGSGFVGILSWKIMFAISNNPPHNNRYKYYRQLFFAHLIFSTLALYGYKLPDYVKRATLIEK